MRIFKEEPVKQPLHMDKLAIGFLSDVLYIKGLICWEEYDDIQKITHASDLDQIIDKMLRGEYNAYKRGEGYIVTSDERK